MNPEVQPGGRALKFYASVRLDIRRAEILKKDGEFIGIKSKIKAVKNKVAPPFREEFAEIIFNKGISKEASIIDMAESFGFIKKSGAWYYPDPLDNEFKTQGKNNTVAWLEENPDVYEMLYDMVKDAKLGIPDESKEEGEEEKNES